LDKTLEDLAMLLYDEIFGELSNARDLGYCLSDVVAEVAENWELRLPGPASSLG
jgi:hypothetical protein